MSKKLPTGLDGRARDQNPPKGGEIRQKRADTRVDTLRETYPGLVPGVRGDAHLGTIRDRTGKSLSQLVKDSKK